MNVLWRDRYLTPEGHGDISMDGHYFAGTCVTVSLAVNAITVGMKLLPARGSFSATMQSIGLQFFGMLLLKLQEKQASRAVTPDRALVLLFPVLLQIDILQTSLALQTTGLTSVAFWMSLLVGEAMTMVKNGFVGLGVVALWYHKDPLRTPTPDHIRELRRLESVDSVSEIAATLAVATFGSVEVGNTPTHI